MLAFSLLLQFLADGFIIPLILESPEIVDELEYAFSRSKTSLCGLDHPAAFIRGG
jgi:hypothetical protein